MLVGLQVVKSAIPPPVLRFHVPAHNRPVVGITGLLGKAAETGQPALTDSVELFDAGLQLVEGSVPEH